MYMNGKKQAKRIMRKIAEQAFDTEVLRDFLCDMDFAKADNWSEVVQDLDEIVYAFTEARDLAKAALAETQGDPVDTPTPEQKPAPESRAGSPANPFAAKKPTDPKAKGG